MISLKLFLPSGYVDIIFLFSVMWAKFMFWYFDKARFFNYFTAPNNIKLQDIYREIERTWKDISGFLSGSDVLVGTFGIYLAVIYDDGDDDDDDNDWNDNDEEDVDILNSASRILQCWSYYMKINSARHQHDTERTKSRTGL